MADIADADLPVFPFRINWKNGIAERLEWKTDVLKDFAGNEQRRGLRLTPRREFEVTLTVWDAERSFLDLWLHRMLSQEFLFPVWHDSVRASLPAPQGQDTIWVDTRGLEFQIGSYGLLRGPTALLSERIEIAEVYDDRIVAAANLVLDWPKGTRVEPLLRGRMTEQTRASLSGGRAGDTQAVFQTTREAPYSLGAAPADQYAALPVMMPPPNRSEQIDMNYIWSFFESDSMSGRSYRRSDEKRSMIAQKHSWFLHGRAAKAAFRSLLYRLKGSLMPFWLPTFNHDLQMAVDTAPGASTLEIDAIGFSYTGGPTSGREYIVIDTVTQGRIYRRVTGTAAAPNGRERLVVDAPFAGGLLRQNVNYISWIDTARLENDRLELTHVNAADGVTTVSAIMRTFRNGPDGVMVNLNSQGNASDTLPAAIAKGITIAGFEPSDLLRLTMPPGQAYSAWSPWGVPPKTVPNTGSWTDFYVAKDGDPDRVVRLGSTTIYDGYEAARSAFQPTILTGAASYTFFIMDSPFGDNSGGLSIKVSVLGE
ncbi:hypothetical protein [Sphingomonas phage Carli]|nr:hypothetical protein [Sphingomonas phage Carli]